MSLSLLSWFEIAIPNAKFGICSFIAILSTHRETLIERYQEDGQETIFILHFA